MAGADPRGLEAGGPRPGPAPDDTAAFQRFYLAEPDQAAHGWLYRLLVAWWRKPAGR